LNPETNKHTHETAPPILERLFHLKQNKTNVHTEILAGVTTFITMAYILLVYPNILKETGMPVDAVFAATCIASAFGTLVMGLYANYPLALAPGMGLGAYFTYTVCGSMGISWQTALGAVFISGIVFFLLTVTKVREWIVAGVPPVLCSAIGVGVGLFIAFIGLRNAGIVVQSDSTLVMLGDMKDPGVLIALTGLVVTSLLLARKVKGAFLLGILFTTVAAICIGVSPAPQGISSIIQVSNPLTSIRPVALQLDIAGAMEVGLITILLSFTFVDFFDSVGTLIGVSRKAGLVDENGNIPRVGKALLADSLGTIFSSLSGTSTVTSYLESASGISEGGRTGLTAVVVAVLFLIALLFSPLVALIPTVATAPVLIIVGAYDGGNCQYPI